MKRVFSFFLISVTLLGAIFLAWPNNPQIVLASTAEEIQDLNKKIAEQKEKIKQLESSISVYKKNIAAKQTEAASLKNQLGILDNRLAQLQADIELTEEKIDATQLEIRVLGLSISEKEKVIVKQKEFLKELIQGVQANDQKNSLEILLTNDSFADFYSQLTYLENLYTELGSSVRTIRLAKEELNNKKKEVEKRKKSYEDLQKSLVDKKKDLDEQFVVKQDLLVSTRSSELRYKTLLDSLRAQYQAVEGEVRNYEEQVRKKLAAQDKIPDSGNVTMTWPVPSRYVTARFRDPDYPFRRVFEHNAIDIRASHGTAVQAAASGYVGRARRCTTSTCYSYVLLIHTGNISTVYGHLSSIAVADDQFVNRGDVIGYSGATPGTVGAGPFVTGPHLHFEVRKNGIPVDPLGYLLQ